MYYYEGHTCPVCGKPFDENDDIVVCPQCGLPHHRACWATQGHCHLQHLHGTTEQWNPDKDTSAPTDQSATYQCCPRCQTKNPQYAEFCQHCGSHLTASNDWTSDNPKKASYGEYQPFRNTAYSAYPTDRDEELDGIKADDLTAFVGQRADYYLPRFRQMSRNNKNASWNWAAFLFGPLWLLYRKMYAYGTLLILLELLHTIASEITFKVMGIRFTDNMTYAEIYRAVESSLAIPEHMYCLIAVSILSAILFIISILLALYGNRLYRDHCSKTITRLREKTPDLTSGELGTSGGTSIAVAIIGYIAQYFLTQILLIFL